MVWPITRGKSYVGETGKSMRVGRISRGLLTINRLSTSAIAETARNEAGLFLLPQLRVLLFGFFQDGDVGVGVFPEGEEILVGGLGFGRVAGDGVCAGKLETG